MDEKEIKRRDKDYSGQAKVREQLGDLYATVCKGWADKRAQNDTLQRCWDVYNCVLNDQQAYAGASKVYIPLVQDAVEALTTRYVNMLFPPTERSVGLISETGDIPYATVALLEHYVRKINVRQQVEAMVRGGIVTGQFNLYLSWRNNVRYVTTHSTNAVQTDLDTPIEGTEYPDVVLDQEVRDSSPDVMVLATEDLLILPPTVDRIEDAEIVVVRKRLTKAAVAVRAQSGEYEDDAADRLKDMFGSKQSEDTVDPDSQANEAAGVKSDGAQKVAEIYEVWTRLKIDGERRWCVTDFAGADVILRCRRNPYWNDRVPVLSIPRAKVGGSVWGQSAIAGGVERLQYSANDTWNMGQDSAQYALLPIVMTDPEKNPRVGSMVLAMAAIWETDPNSTKFAAFPPLWKDSLSLVLANRDQIMQSMGINPAMLPHGNAGKKPTQGQIAQEQQVAMESVAMPIADIEQGILSPMLEWFHELDAQFRDDTITVETFGELGLRAKMEQVPVQQQGEGFHASSSS